METKLQNFLLNYRTTPQGTTGVPPCQLLMGRQLKTRLDLILPDINKHVENAQAKQYHNCHSKPRSFQQGDKLLVCNYRSHPFWLPGVIKNVLGPVSYQVALSDGQLWKRHVDQLLNDNSQRSDSDVVECDTQESIDIDFPPNDIQ